MTRARPSATALRRLLTVGAFVALAVGSALGLWQALDAPSGTPQQQTTAIAAGLRCPTCQGLSVADSAAPIANSMREIIAEQLADGRTPDEVRGYFVARYGEWILLSPRTGGLGWLVWFLPVAAVLGGTGAALSQTRRRPTAVPAADLDHAAELADRYAAGRLALPQTPAGERLEAALELASAIADDREDASTGAQRNGMIRIAAALAAQRREATVPAVAAGRDRAAAPAADDRVAGAVLRRRGMSYAGGTAAFAAVLLGLLAFNLAPRGVGDLPTGNLPEFDSGPSATAELDALRASVEQDPSNIAARLDLASQLLQAGDVGGAQVQARAVLDQQPDHPDGLLLLGLALFTDGSPVAPQTLQRFLDAAPPEHPGIPLARSLMDPQQ